MIGRRISITSERCGLTRNMNLARNFQQMSIREGSKFTATCVKFENIDIVLVIWAWSVESPSVASKHS